MGGLLILYGFIWLVIKIADERSWNTNAYDGKEYDVTKAFQDSCVNRISTSEFKRNYKSGKYR